MAVKYADNDVMPLADQEVLVSLDEGATIGDNGLFGPEWFTVGVLVDGSALEINRQLDEETTVGKGRGVVARKFKPGDVTGQYEVLSRNAVTQYIAFPDTVVSGKVGLERHTSKVARLRTAYVDYREDGIIAVRTSRLPAVHRMEQLGRNESPEGATVNIGFLPDGNKVVFETTLFKVNKDGSMTKITPKVIVPQSQIPANADNYQAGEGTAAGVIAPETLEDLAKKPSKPGPGAGA